MCNQVTSKLASRCVVSFELRMFKVFPPAYRTIGFGVGHLKRQWITIVLGSWIYASIVELRYNRYLLGFKHWRKLQDHDTTRSLLGAAKTENTNHFIVTSHRSLISWWIVRCGTWDKIFHTCSNYISTRSGAWVSNSKSWDKYFNDLFSAAFQLLCRKGHAFDLGVGLSSIPQFHHKCRCKWEEPPAPKLRTTGQSFTHSLPLRDFAPTVRSFHANVLQKCPAPQEKAVAWRVYLV